MRISNKSQAELMLGLGLHFEKPCPESTTKEIQHSCTTHFPASRPSPSRPGRMKMQLGEEAFHQGLPGKAELHVSVMLEALIVRLCSA